jgi:hypothetical protein
VLVRVPQDALASAVRGALRPGEDEWAANEAGVVMTSGSLALVIVALLSARSRLVTVGSRVAGRAFGPSISA